MGLFYAYLKHSEREDVSRFLIVFADRETADEWWRTVSTPPSPYMGYVQRYSPQFYIDNPDIAGKFFEWQGSKPFLNRMFFLLLNDRGGRELSIAPPAEFTDHISGGWYFIRSKAEPRRYWCFNNGNNPCPICEDRGCDLIHVSTTFRTKFRIQVRGKLNERDFVMIGSDKVSISASNNHNLHATLAGEIKATQDYQTETSDILFGDLKDRFATRQQVKMAFRQVVICEDVVPVERGVGEEWELAR